MSHHKKVRMEPIGEVRTPYTDWAPRQPLERDAQEGRFRLVLRTGYEEGLRDIERFAGEHDHEQPHGRTHGGEEDDAGSCPTS